MRQSTTLPLVILTSLILNACASRAPTPTPGSAGPTSVPGPTAAVSTPTPSGEVTAEEFTAPGVAPEGARVRLDTWTPGSKLGMGTAFTYDQPGTGNPSTVWFAITDGAITEVSYPTVDQANVKTLSLLVTDGKSFAIRDNDPTQTDIQIDRLDGRTPAYRIIASAKDGRWRTIKEVLTDPRQNALVVRVHLEVEQGQADAYQMYVTYWPHLGQSGQGDTSHVDNDILLVSDPKAGVATALTSQPLPLQLTTGYLGSESDPIQDLQDFKLDHLYTRTGKPGYIASGMQIPSNAPVTVALGLGDDEAGAAAAAGAALQRGFEIIRDEYMAGWARWLASLNHPANADRLYEWSAVVLKAHLDKRNPGAGIASIAVPWGQWLPDDDPDERGYRYVWPRDLYHTAMALLVLGDEEAARQVLAYMDDQLQRDTGALPQNQFIDGRRRWPGLQLDEVADPILLAWQLKALDRYGSLVKPAADFLMERGPRTPQERWEENGGYSPASLAAEIAGLVCAADLAQQSGDTASANAWLAKADEWNRQVESWTYTSNGPLGDGKYYLRLTGQGDPDKDSKISIGNGGGTHDQREVIDPSFLELVRLGVRSPLTGSITSTLPEIDATIRANTANGPAFFRYPFDGYGEKKPGEMANGRGHPWPLLAGERGVYEVLAGHPDQAREILTSLQKFANAGGMLPEQVFEDTGQGTGSATPLVWAHAEYILLANAVDGGAVADRPQVVVERYGK